MTSTVGKIAVDLGARPSPVDPVTIVVSIVIVTWNNARIIGRCLGSLSSLAMDPRVEIIVVDNASSDVTPAVIRAAFPYARLIENRDNLGFAAGNNAGIRVSKGKYVCLINSDVVVSPACVEKLLQYMSDHPDVGVSGPRMILPDGSTGRSCMRFPTVANWLWRALAVDVAFGRSRRFASYLMTDFDHDRLTDVDVLTGWFWLIRRQAISQVGLLDERFFMYGEDLDWCKRFRHAGWRVVFYPEATAIHYCAGSSSRSPVRLYVEKTRSSLLYCMRHHSWSAVACFRLVLWIHEFIRLVGYGTRCVVTAGRADAAFRVKRSWTCMLWLMGGSR